MHVSLTSNEMARWVTPPPSVLSEEIVSAIRKAVKLLCDGIGIASPVGQEVEPMELSDGCLNVTMTRNGRFLAHWEPVDEWDDDEAHETSVLH